MQLPPRRLAAVPSTIQRPLVLFRAEREQVDALMAAARDLRFDSRQAIEVICNSVRSARPKADGIVWQNSELGDIWTHSIFLETFDLRDLVTGTPVALDESDHGPSSDEPDSTDEVDPAALALWLTNEVDMDQVSGLDEAMLHALTDAVDSADWDVEADSHMVVEPEDTYGILESWKFPGKASRAYVPFEVTGYDDGILTVARTVTAMVRLVSSFEFSIKDGVDKDFMSMGSTEAERNISVQVDAEFGFSGVAERQPHVEWIVCQHIVERVDFGNVEPDGFHGDEDQDEEE
ncbi:hypothetical protein [Pseudoduganella armeniaca]|uniref:Uncharacterized protein n=1 Tax=Pseudoduganella armeniaca TaxID=2072590 RepID=A0A2R4CBP4_9BURK|nr:hypothetical protein [Pseudoduganella armeniaca]AVR96910.1 hypothetical protein C9I28_15485 [Pseudoduganella armeniaca]